VVKSFRVILIATSLVTAILLSTFVIPVTAQEVVNYSAEALRVMEFGDWYYMSARALSYHGIWEEATLMHGINVQGSALSAFTEVFAMFSADIFNKFEAWGLAVSNFGTETRTNTPTNNVQQSEVTISINPTNPNNLVAGSHLNNLQTGSVGCNAYFSNDGGSTWTDIGTLPGITVASGDPVVASDALGNHYYNCLEFAGTNNVLVSKSTDGGASFGAPVIAASGNPSVFNDKIWIVADTFPGSPNVNNIYVSWSQISAAGTSLQFVRSTNQGTSFSAPITISTGGANQDSHPFVAPNGDVFVVWLDLSNSQIVIARSTNAGVSFGAPVVIDSQFFEPFVRFLLDSDGNGTPDTVREGIDLNGCVDGSGRLNVIWSDFASAISTESDIFYSSSTDNGGTWSAPTVVNSVTANDQFFPAIACQQDDNTAHFAWIDRRNDPLNNRFIDVFYASTNTGLPPFTNLQVTTVASDLQTTIALPFEPKIGDYIDMDASSIMAHPVWTDLRVVAVPTNTGGDVFTSAGIKTQPAVCGDGIVNQPTEQCDPQPPGSLPTATCDINCQNIVQPICGDGIVNQPTEQCDPAPAGSLPTATCDINCQNIVQPACTVDSDCDDGQFCTLDSCVAGVCVFNPNPDPSCERVGGEFIGVDTTALLVAGFQANALWLLPAIAAIGIAAVVIRRIR